VPKHSFKNFDEARKWAKKNIVGIYKNIDTEEDIYIAKRAIDKYMSASAVLKSVNKDVHLSTLKQLPKLIKDSILAEAQADKANNYHIKEIQRFYGVVNYEGNPYLVKTTVKVIKNEGNKAYSYEVRRIKSPVTRVESPGQSILSG